MNVFSPRTRQRAWNRWLVFKRARAWLKCATGGIGDFYWCSDENYTELRRRKCVDDFGRVTATGRRAGAFA